MKRIIPTKTYGDRRADDTQHLISEQSVTATITRPAGNTMTGSRTMTAVGSFECRVDMLSLGPRYLEQRDQFGRTPTLTYRLTACPTVDKNGNAVNIQHNDTVVVGSQTFVALYVNRLPWLTEAVLETRQ